MNSPLSQGAEPVGRIQRGTKRQHVFMYQQDLEDGTPLYLHPAPPLPEGWLETAMKLVDEIARAKWSEGISGASYMDKAGERRSAEEAAEFTAELRHHLLLAVPYRWRRNEIA